MSKWEPTQPNIKKAFFVAGAGAVMAVSGVIAFFMFNTLWSIPLFVAGVMTVGWVERW